MRKSAWISFVILSLFAIVALADKTFIGRTQVRSTPGAQSSDAQFEVNTTLRGSRPFPRGTTVQRDAISSPQDVLLFWNTDTARLEKYTASISAWEDAAGRTGEIVDFGGSSLPPDRLACNGAAVSRTTYKALFARYGTTHGSGDGSTTFNLPDCRRRTTAGAGGSSTAGPSTTVGSTGGAETMEAHTHTITDPGHVHTYTIWEGTNTGVLYPSSANDGIGSWTGTTDSATTGISVNSGGSHTHTASASTTGTGTGQGNFQPTLIVTKAVIF